MAVYDTLQRTLTRVATSARAAAETVERLMAANGNVFVDDDEVLAAEYDRARGYDRPRKERSKEAYEMAEGAPMFSWVPPARRARALARARRAV